MIVTEADCDLAGAAAYDDPAADSAAAAAAVTGDGRAEGVGAPAYKASAAAAAAASALAEEGVEWLSTALPAAAEGAAAIGPSGSQPRQQEGLSSEPPDLDSEARSVQLRQRPHRESTEAAVDAATRSRVAREVAAELAEAEATVVHHHGGHPDVGIVAPADGSTGSFVEVKKVTVVSDIGGGSGAELTQATAAAAAAADDAAAAVAAEARRAVWGEDGWPYGSSMQSADLAEELKRSIQQLQDEADQGSMTTLLP